MKTLFIACVLFLAAGCGNKPAPVDVTKTFAVQGDGILIEGGLKAGATVSADVYKAGIQQAIKKK